MFRKKLDRQEQAKISQAYMDFISYSDKKREQRVMSNQTIGTPHRHVWIPIDPLVGFKHLDVICNKFLASKLTEKLHQAGYSLKLKCGADALGADEFTPCITINPILSETTQMYYANIRDQHAKSIMQELNK